MNAANSALFAYQQTVNQMLTAAKGTVSMSMESAEYLAYKPANLALTAAQANMRGLDLAKSALDIAKSATTGALDLVKWAAEKCREVHKYSQC